jgi:hypothetical protein
LLTLSFKIGRGRKYFNNDKLKSHAGNKKGKTNKKIINKKRINNFFENLKERKKKEERNKEK